MVSAQALHLYVLVVLHFMSTFNVQWFVLPWFHKPDLPRPRPLLRLVTLNDSRMTSGDVNSRPTRAALCSKIIRYWWVGQICSAYVISRKMLFKLSQNVARWWRHQIKRNANYMFFGRLLILKWIVVVFCMTVLSVTKFLPLYAQVRVTTSLVLQVSLQYRAKN